MKKILAAFAVIAALAGAVRADIDAGELTSIALKDAVNDAKASLAAAKQIPSDKAVAILPFAGDKSGKIVGLLKNALTDAGKTCVEGKEDAMWNEILKEIE